MKWIVILLLLLLFGCIETKRQPFLKLRSFHHDHQCFTQGLQIRDGRIVESCGLNGKSSIRIVHSHNGTIIMERKLPYKYFAEGLVVVNNSIYVLTWKNKEILVLDLETLNILESRPFSTYSVGSLTFCFDFELLNYSVVFRVRVGACLTMENI